MHISGIVVISRPHAVHGCAANLASLPGLELHYQDTASGKIIATLETHTIDAAVACLQRIRQLPHVLLAEMVYHYCAEDPASSENERTREDLCAEVSLSLNR